MHTLNVQEEYDKIPEEERSKVLARITASKAVYGSRWEIEFFNNFSDCFPSKIGFSQRCSEEMARSIDEVVCGLGMTRDYIGQLRDDWWTKRTPETAQVFFVVYYRLLQKGCKFDDVRW